MKILMTGLSSFIGQKLIKELGDKVEILNIGREFFTGSKSNINSLLFDDPRLEEKVISFKPDIFLNIASSSRNKNSTLEDYKLMSGFNISTSSYLVDLAIIAKVRLTINLSTNWAYLSETKDPKFFNYYAFTKYALDKYISNICKINKCNAITLILYDNFDRFDPRKKIFNLILDAIENNVKTDFSPGNQIINLTRMQDLVFALKYIIFNELDVQGHKYFQVTGGEISVINLAKVIQRVIGKDYSNILNFGALPYRKGEIMKPNYFFEELPYIGSRKDNLSELIKDEISKKK